MRYAQVFVGSLASSLTYSNVEMTEAGQERQCAAHVLFQDC